jgi:hypothetical protein
MKIEDARAMLEPYGVIIHYDDALKLYMLILNSVIVYMHPEDLRNADEPELKTFIAQYVLQHIASNPTVTLH